MKKYISMIALISMTMSCSKSGDGIIDDEIPYNDNLQDEVVKKPDTKVDIDTALYHSTFVEQFDKQSNFFSHVTGGKGAPFTWEMGSESLSEPGTKILLLKLDPDEEAGAGKGPEVVSKKFTYYGTYAARMKVSGSRNLQPNVGAVIGYFTYQMDNVHGLSEIDYEWLIADPQIIYVGTWTGHYGRLKRIGRTVNMATGHIYETSFREEDGSGRRALVGKQNQPEKIRPIEGFDASSQFHTYGFDWHQKRIRWWMLHPVTNDTIVIWDYQGSEVGIPTTHTRYRMNMWHTDNWPVETNPNSIEKPAIPFELEVDWISYTPSEPI